MKDIYIVIVLYKCNIYQARAYSSLIKGLGKRPYMIYDNSPLSFAQTSNIPENAMYIRDTENKGLPAAYNRAAAEAASQGFHRLLLLDQDTFFPKGCWKAYEKASDYDGIVAPQLQTDSGTAFSPIDISCWSTKGVNLEPGEYSLFNYNVVNSGICVPISLFEQVGGYSPQVRLDFADYQFNRQIRKLRPAFLLLGFTALQDFSDDCTDTHQLLTRYKLYAQSAKAFTTEGMTDALKHHFSVLKHTLALTLRTRSTAFIKEYIVSFLLPDK